MALSLSAFLLSTTILLSTVIQCTPTCSADGYYCVKDGKHDQKYFECALPWFQDFRDCAPGTVCNVEGYHPVTENPCIQPPDTCGNGQYDNGEECDGGEGCLFCFCRSGWQPTSPRSKNCVLVDGSGATNPTDPKETRPTDDCIDATGGSCPPGRVLTGGRCDVTELCGNNRLDPGEECDGGYGCTCKCTCKEGLVPTTPRSISCKVPSCVPDRTCDQYGFNCGDFYNGCCMISCGNCTSGQTCCNNRCVPVPKCGNGVIDEGEECDGGYGCDANCKCKPGYRQKYPPSIHCCLVDCVPNRTCHEMGFECGDFWDGCGTISCGTCDPGFVCRNNKCTCVPTCGNGVVDPGEQCDGGVGCNSDCTCIDGYVPTTPPGPSCKPKECVPTRTCAQHGYECGDLDDGCTIICCGPCPTGEFCQNHKCVAITQCGNCRLDEGEECDGGSFCGPDCKCLPGYVPTDPLSINCQIPRCIPTRNCSDFGYECGPFDNGCCNISCGVCPIGFNCENNRCVPGPRCGDGIIQPGEQCDGGIGCGPDCQCLPDFIPYVPPATSCQPRPCVPITSCIIAGQTCGSLFNGCETLDCGTCAPGSTCNGTNCVPFVNPCGNGRIDNGEQCDGGLGCGPNCICEPGYIPTTPVSINCQRNNTCIPVTCAQAGIECGDFFNGCETVCCGNCTYGFKCVNNRCEPVCRPDKSCKSCHAECGEIFNGCEKEFCGHCPFGHFCKNNKCFPPCGNGAVDDGEECDGGINCDEFCRCKPGFEPTIPRSHHCVPVKCCPFLTCHSHGFHCGEVFDGCEIVSCGRCPSHQSCVNHRCVDDSRCHNGVLDFGEECDGGIGCHNCKCIHGFRPTHPRSRSCECVPHKTCHDADVECGRIWDGCKNITCGKCCVGKTCIRGECVDLLCGNGEINPGEQCDGGIGCCECQCSEGFQPTVPPSLNCVPDIPPCPCIPITTCRLSNITCGPLFNGCEFINCGNCSNASICFNGRCVSTCGNGDLEAGEQCDGGFHCTNCTCDPGYEPTDPVSRNCRKIPCVPTTNCDLAGVFCGPLFDGCCLLSCGYCGTNFTCVNNTCVEYCEPRCGDGIVEAWEECDGGVHCGANCLCEPGYQPTDPVSVNCTTSACTPVRTCESVGAECGLIFNGCRLVFCGFCGIGRDCIDHSCVCLPTTTCEQESRVCGELDTGCGVVGCGFCAENFFCQQGQCVPSVP